MSKRAEQEITEMAHRATAGWYYTNPQRMAAAIRGYKLGYKQAEQDLISIIESRILEILGDAQPNPILRLELQGIINKIKEI